MTAPFGGDALFSHDGHLAVARANAASGIVSIVLALCGFEARSIIIGALAGAVAFAAAYIAIVLNWINDDRRPLGYSLALLQLVLAVALTVGDQSSWGYLFCYCAACVAIIAPEPIGFLAVIGCAGIQIAATEISRSFASVVNRVRWKSSSAAPWFASLSNR